MARQLDRILVIDIESTCWPGEPPAGQQSEIIEIGVCLLDPVTGDRDGKRSILVRPELSEVSAFCSALTTLTAADVAGGMSFAAACSVLRREYRSRDRVFASYGDYDRKQFERQCSPSVAPYPFGPTHLNVKSLAALGFGWPREAGMPLVLEQLDRPLEGTHHRGHDDAWNIAGILGTLLLSTRFGLSERSI